MNILRKFTNSVAFYGKFATFSDFKKFEVFFRKNPSIFSKRDPKFEHFEKSVAFYGIFATFIVFWLNSSFFPGRTHLLSKKHQNLNVLLNLTFSVAFYGKLATLSNLKNIPIFFKKLIFLPWKNPISERFDNSYFFMSIERQLCYLKWFLKNSRFCSEENASVSV